MIRDPRTRRRFSLAFLILGGLLLFLAPDDIWLGGLLLALGVALEIAGALMHRRLGG